MQPEHAIPSHLTSPAATLSREAGHKQTAEQPPAQVANACEELASCCARHLQAYKLQGQPIGKHTPLRMIDSSTGGGTTSTGLPALSLPDTTSNLAAATVVVLPLQRLRKLIRLKSDAGLCQH